MDIFTLKTRFFKAVTPYRPNDWEVEEHLEGLVGLSDPVLDEIFVQVTAIWPVSNALCYRFLGQVKQGLSCLSPDQLSDWVKATLDVYEEHGLKQAGIFMADAESNFLCQIRGESGLTYDEVHRRLLSYLQGISERSLELASSNQTYTDTSTIYIPKEITGFDDRRQCFILYKYTITFQWGLIVCSVFRDHKVSEVSQTDASVAKIKQKKDAKLTLADCCATFSDQQLFIELYQLFAAFVVKRWLEKQFPGLARDSKDLMVELCKLRRLEKPPNGKSKLVESLKQHLLGSRERLALSQAEQRRSAELRFLAGQVADATLNPMVAAVSSYQILDRMPGKYHPTAPLSFLGMFKPAAVQAMRLQKRKENREEFINSLAGLLPVTPSSEQAEKHEGLEHGSSVLQQSDAAVIIPEHRGDTKEQVENQEQGPDAFIRIGETEFEIPESMQQLIREITDDYGRIPSRYISAAMKIAGSAPSGFAGPAEEKGRELTGPIVYDEWDFRRQGFRKNWCRLLEKEVQPVKSTFMNTTLTKYRGSLLQLKSRFEMLRTQERFVRRQKEGSEVDLDALIESRSDYQAGLAPSENLFIRLQRDERNIAVVFLVDMSSSTEGWVNRALKESLILMSEALEVLGDRYAIYGFSGMRRLRSEFYHIKHFEEKYSDSVKGRIAGIMPIDYTRMGPPIRHVTRMFEKIEAKVRLLITLSDGKPEDYDDYKGDYAVEDTRHALIEAKAAGIHPFCITIDKKAHDYISHMYGEVNYILIDKVEQLPLRIPEIYRNLTT